MFQTIVGCEIEVLPIKHSWASLFREGLFEAGHIIYLCCGLRLSIGYVQAIARGSATTWWTLSSLPNMPFDQLRDEYSHQLKALRVPMLLHIP